MRQKAFWEPNPKKCANIIADSKLIQNTEMLAPDLVGDQSEILVSHFFTHISYLWGDNQEDFLHIKVIRAHIWVNRPKDIFCVFFKYFVDDPFNQDRLLSALQ